MGEVYRVEDTNLKQRYNDQVQLRQGFAESVRQTKTRRKLKNIHKTEDPAVNCNGWLGSLSLNGTRITRITPIFAEKNF